MRCTTRYGRTVAALAAVSLVAAACGGGDGNGDDGDAPGEEVAADGENDAGQAAGGEVPDSPDDGVTADAIKVGWMGDVTGATASAQVINLRGIEAYFEKVNAEGGVLGRELELIVKDDEYAAETGVANFQQLVNDDRVLTITQLGGSHVVDAVLGDAERFGMPLVVAGQTTNTSLESPVAYHLMSHYFDQADVAVARMIDDVGSPDDLRVGVVQLEVPSGDEWNLGVERALEAQGGTYLGRLTISTATPDEGSFVGGVRQLIDEQDMNYIAAHIAPAQGLFVVNNLSAADLDVPVVGMQGMASLNIYQEGADDQLERTEGVHTFLTYADESEGSAEIAEFLEGEGSGYTADAAHINFSAGWLTGMVVHQAIDRAAETGELTRASFLEGLRGPIDTAGLTCEIDWTDANSNPCAAPFTSDGENMRIVGSFEQWRSVITGDYDY